MYTQVGGARARTLRILSELTGISTILKYQDTPVKYRQEYDGAIGHAFQTTKAEHSTFCTFSVDGVTRPVII